MARPAKTIAQHFRDGTVPQAKEPLASNVVGGRPKIPRHLCPEARTEFKRCVQLLEKRDTITPGDYATLTVYAEVFARWIQAKTEVGKDLMVETVITDNHGEQHLVRRLNPLLKVVEQCESRMLALVKTLGLTPTSRDKVKPTKEADAEKPVDPVDAFLARGNRVLPIKPLSERMEAAKDEPES